MAGAGITPVCQTVGKKPVYRFHPCGLGCSQRLREIEPRWVYQIDPQAALRLAPLRKAEISPLTKIAQKWGMPEWLQKRPNRYRVNRPLVGNAQDQSNQLYEAAAP